MPEHYDSIVIGAGIAGCCTAYALQKKGQKVLLVDRSAVAASGGSGAAGAFVSPKIGKGSPLQTLTNEAFHFSKDFYLEHFPDYFHQTGLIRIPKDEEDAQKFEIYEPFNESKYRWVEKDALEKTGIYNSEDSFMFEEAGVCDAPEMCEAILEKVEFQQMDVGSLEWDGEFWNIALRQAQGTVAEPVEARLLSPVEAFSDPLVPDVAFTPNVRKNYSHYIAMYHDQGLAPLKALYFDEGINVSLNLPILRTSVDHGTAFDIAYKSVELNSLSYINAIKYIMENT